MIVDIRGYSTRRFGTEADRQRYLAECRRIRKTMTVRFQVAPGESVKTPSGSVLEAGTQVTAAMLHGKQDEPAWRVLKELVDSGRVLEADSVVADAAQTERK